MKGFWSAPRPIQRSGDRSPARSLLYYVWRMSGWQQVWVCLLAAVVAGISMVPIELQRRIIDDAIGDDDLQLLAQLAAVYLGVLLLQAGLKFVLHLYQGWLSESATRYCRSHLIEQHGHHLEAGEEQDKRGRAVSVIVNEIDVLGGFVGEGLSQPVVNIGMLLAIAGYMLVVQPLVALGSFLFLLPQCLVVPLVQRRINRLVERRLGLIRRLSDDVSAVESVPDAGRPERLPGLLDGIFANRMQIFFAKFAMKAASNFLNAVAPLSVLLVGGYFVLQGTTSIGVVVAFMSGFDRMANPVRELLAYYRFAAQATVQHRMIARWI